MKTLHILPTQTKMNPHAPKENPFFEPGLVLYVVRKDRGGYAAVTSWGHLGRDYEVGCLVELRHDQTCKRIDFGMIMMIVDFSTGTRYTHPLGVMHPLNLKHYVVK